MPSLLLALALVQVLVLALVQVQVLVAHYEQPVRTVGTLLLTWVQAPLQTVAPVCECQASHTVYCLPRSVTARETPQQPLLQCLLQPVH